MVNDRGDAGAVANHRLAVEAGREVGSVGQLLQPLEHSCRACRPVFAVLGGEKEVFQGF